MKISAGVTNREGQHQVTLQTNENVQSIMIPPKVSGLGSSVNGGELLFLALATCYCNDLYREAGKRGIKVQQVEVEVDGDFGGEGDPARNVTYRAKVTAQAAEEDIQALIEQTDRLTEIQNTLRTGTPVVLTSFEAISV
jgi:organic hydroperoxide reductase OsmC/OhrA